MFQRRITTLFKNSSNPLLTSLKLLITAEVDKCTATSRNVCKNESVLGGHSSDEVKIKFGNLFHVNGILARI